MRIFFKVLSIVGAVTKWADKALEDGKIDRDEAIELVKLITQALDIDTVIHL